MNPSVRKWLGRLERFLGSSVLSLACFVILSTKLLSAAGFQWDEMLLAAILYINFSTKLEQIHASAMSGSAQDREAGLGPKGAGAARSEAKGDARP